MDKLLNEMMQWLGNNGVEYESNAVETIKNTWEKNKSLLLEKFRLHPNWNEDAKAIIFKNDYERGFNKNAIKEFANWVHNELSMKANKIDKAGEINDLEEKIDSLNYIYRKLCKEREIQKLNLMINNEPARFKIEENIEKTKKEKDALYETTERYAYYRIEKEIAKKYTAVDKALAICKKAETNLTSKTIADEVNAIIPEIKAVEGQKISKVIQKICKTAEIDKIVYINDYGTYQRDDGYNRQYAMLCNEINPITYKRITVISLNPIDYWSMSHGKNWHSCHYVGNGDDGCYSSGTESYMLDKVSVIYYVIDENYEGTDYAWQDKINRCVFCINEDGNVILESRVYPDDRDGGDSSLGRQFRDVMSLTVSQLWNVNNYWNTKKGSSECREITESYGTHYRDYIEYENSVAMINVNYNKPVLIRIGHDPICPVCGEEHSNEENVVCEYCLEDCKITCERCGDRVNEDYAIRTSDGSVYCCSNCANNDGYYWCYDTDEYEYEDDIHYCENDNEYHLIDNCYYDNYDECYYSGDPYITTEDGNNYSSEEHAEEDGYINVNGCWYTEDETVEINEEYYLKDDCIQMDDGEYMIDEEDAEEKGYIYTEDSIWMKKEDAIEVEEGIYYSTEEDAKINGYEYDEENNEWRVA